MNNDIESLAADLIDAILGNGTCTKKASEEEIKNLTMIVRNELIQLGWEYDN
jgi:hypothetical protein